MIAYKLFRQRKDGTLGSLFINRKAIIPIGKLIKAKSYPTKGFAVRPGWHCTHSPNAPHLSMKGRVWCKVAISDFETIVRPINQGGLWYLSTSMKVIEIV